MKNWTRKSEVYNVGLLLLMDIKVTMIVFKKTLKNVILFYILEYIIVKLTNNNNKILKSLYSLYSCGHSIPLFSSVFF